jgi:hypothetical protein
MDAIVKQDVLKRFFFTVSLFHESVSEGLKSLAVSSASPMSCRTKNRLSPSARTPAKRDWEARDFNPSDRFMKKAHSEEK